jgi:hypothetical protein
LTRGCSYVYIYILGLVDKSTNTEPRKVSNQLVFAGISIKRTKPAIAAEGMLTPVGRIGADCGRDCPSITSGNRPTFMTVHVHSLREQMQQSTEMICFIYSSTMQRKAANIVAKIIK